MMREGSCGLGFGLQLVHDVFAGVEDGQKWEDQPETCGEDQHEEALQVEADEFRGEVLDIEHVDDGLPKYEAASYHSNECPDELLFPAAGGGKHHRNQEHSNLHEVQVRLDHHERILQVSVKGIILDVEIVG